MVQIKATISRKILDSKLFVLRKIHMKARWKMVSTVGGRHISGRFLEIDKCGMIEVTENDALFRQVHSVKYSVSDPDSGVLWIRNPDPDPGA